MGSNRYNQFVKQRMRDEQPDVAKLIQIASMMRQDYGLTVHREKILLFNSKTGELKGHYSFITKQQFNRDHFHVPDLIFFIKSKMYVFEIDGPIHDTNAAVAKKDQFRNEDYQRAGLNFEIFNEWEILLSQGESPTRSATADELIPEIKKRVEKILEENSITF